MTHKEALEYAAVDESSIDFQTNTVTLTVPVEWLELVNGTIKKQIPTQPVMVSEYVNKLKVEYPACPSCGRVLDMKYNKDLVCSCGQKLKHCEYW